MIGWVGVLTHAVEDLWETSLHSIQATSIWCLPLNLPNQMASRVTASSLVGVAAARPRRRQMWSGCARSRVGR